MKLIKNSLITIKQKGLIVFLMAVINFLLILFYQKFLPTNLIKKRIFDFRMFLNPIDRGISRTLILFGVRELDHKKILELVLKKNMKVFDLGANIGYYVLMESSIVGKNGKIIAIEPVPENMKLLKKNLELNKNNITTTMQVGISNLTEEKNFLLSEHSNLGHIIDDKHSKNYKNKKKIKIQTISLNKLIKKTLFPDFIRMDVEGYEEYILKDLHTSDNSWNIALLRYFNPVGAHKSGLIGEDPNDIPNNLMPYVSQVAVGKLEQLSVFGDDYPTTDGTGVRDYIHVVDLALGHLKAIEKLKSNPGLVVYNLGTGKGTSVLEMVKAFEDASGKTVKYKIAPRRAGDIATCYADPAKAETELGWTAKRGIKEMCEDAWKWQSENPNGYN